jgi:hypothetical protein
MCGHGCVHVWRNRGMGGGGHILKAQLRGIVVTLKTTLLSRVVVLPNYIIIIIFPMKNKKKRKINIRLRPENMLRSGGGLFFCFCFMSTLLFYSVRCTCVDGSVPESQKQIRSYGTLQQRGSWRPRMKPQKRSRGCLLAWLVFSFCFARHLKLSRLTSSTGWNTEGRLLLQTRAEWKHGGG